MAQEDEVDLGPPEAEEVGEKVEAGFGKEAPSFEIHKGAAIQSKINRGVYTGRVIRRTAVCSRFTCLSR